MLGGSSFLSVSHSVPLVSLVFLAGQSAQPLLAVLFSSSPELCRTCHPVSRGGFKSPSLSKAPCFASQEKRSGQVLCIHQGLLFIQSVWISFRALES